MLDLKANAVKKLMPLKGSLAALEISDVASVFAALAWVGDSPASTILVIGEHNMTNHDKAKIALPRPVLVAIGLLLIMTIAWAKSGKAPDKVVICRMLRERALAQPRFRRRQKALPSS